MRSGNASRNKPEKSRGAGAISLSLPTTSLPDSALKVPKVRQAGHLVDQKLKYNYPVKNPDQPSLFDLLDPDTIGEVKKVEVKYEGIRLTPSEDRLLTAIYSLLKDKSESKDADSATFYKGNYESAEVVPFGGEKVKPAHIRLVPAELYKAYLGNGDYSGRDIKDINTTLEALAEKRFLMTYDRKRIVQVGKKSETRTDRIEMFKRLIEIVKYTRDLTDAELANLDKGDERIRQAKGELIIALNPILTDQINSKYVEYPQDINRRTIIAAGGHPSNVTQAINTLRDWLFRELSSKHYECQINAERLPYVLKLDNYVNQGRKKLIRETIEKAIQTCKNLNLILAVVETKGAEGQAKYVFTLNKDFNKDSE
jgi:recombinational DNA repair protein RecR